MAWKYNQPKFEYESDFMDAGWPWAGHKLFAYDLVRDVRPKKIVELGTHKGTSFFSFCQAVKDQKLDAEVSAVDTWQGDEHAGFYGDEIYQEVKAIANKYYSAVDIRLVRKTFDEALGEFENDSIDLLHVDGLHTYEAVKHDFESWLPKVKKDGIILFHDIEVGEDDFGVYKLWEELKKQYASIEFHHSFGLGVLFLDKSTAGRFINIQGDLRRYYSYDHEKKKSQAVHYQTEENSQLKKELALIKSSGIWKLRDKCVSMKEKLMKK